MASAKKTTKIDKQIIITKYMQYVLDYEHYPKSVYKFCKDVKIKEEDFYKYFGNVDALIRSVWNEFFSNTHQVMLDNKEYENFSSREKMLTFFYTFFELLKMNRSFVLFDLDTDNDSLKKMKKLSGLRKQVREFAAKLIEDDNEEKQYKLTQRPVTLFAEGAWIQLVFLLKFWIDDDSADFEKTDMAIEKSVNTIFDVFDNTPLDSIIDFSKFLWKEKSFWN
ncbi:TetR family transcriptional regulator C-terminal domain-containing protein [Aquimarina brevivitae]|nr:TetR family transcriptional regulator C-terminal domain-containing protein [Aquimarina brevivitae]